MQQENPYIDVLRIREIGASKTKSKICFLDFDGVMNNDKWYLVPEVRKKIKEGSTGDYMFDTNSCRLINTLVQETGMMLVISSDCRNDKVKGMRWLPAMREVIASNNITAETIGLTPFIHDAAGHPQRGEEIEAVLNGFARNNVVVSGYVIIDDCESYILPDQKAHFVKCLSVTGFQEAEYAEALRILCE